MFPQPAKNQRDTTLRCPNQTQEQNQQKTSKLKKIQILHNTLRFYEMKITYISVGHS